MDEREKCLTAVELYKVEQEKHYKLLAEQENNTSIKCCKMLVNKIKSTFMVDFPTDGVIQLADYKNYITSEHHKYLLQQLEKEIPIFNFRICFNGFNFYIKYKLKRGRRKGK